MGDPYLRRLMVVGATSRVRVARRAPERERPLAELLQRKPAGLATVALTNCAARIVWALMARGGVYPSLASATGAPARLPPRKLEVARTVRSNGEPVGPGTRTTRLSVRPMKPVSRLGPRAQNPSRPAVLSHRNRRPNTGRCPTIATTRTDLQCGSHPHRTPSSHSPAKMTSSVGTQER